MPIRPEHRWLYPIDWPELSRLVRFRRAKGRCEGCGRPHGRHVIHMGDGRWWDEDRGCWRDGRGRRVRGLARPGRHAPAQPVLLDEVGRAPFPLTRVVLASAHLDHDPGNNEGPEVLAPFRCFDGYDLYAGCGHRNLRLTSQAI